MHKSRLGGLIIDCETDDLETAARFWGEALGTPADFDANAPESPYVTLQIAEGEPYIEVQSVQHESRVHIDIESDDIEAEVTRLEALGATRVADIRSFVVMQSPTGQKFCVVPVARAGFTENATEWGE